MRSPVDAAGAATARRTLEWVLRGLALAVLALLLARAWRAPDAHARARRWTALPAGDALGAWRDSTRPGDTLAPRFDAAPAPEVRDALAALARAGRAVAWRDGGVPTVAAAVEAPRSPDGAPRLVALAPAAVLALGDAAGTLDSLAVPRDGGAVALAVPGEGRGLTARVGGTVARATMRDSLTLRRVLVLGRAGWEAKFTVAALEEAGWRVDADLAVGPGARVTQGERADAAPDTARHAAVVVLDSVLVPGRAASLARYVRSGGGVVLAGEAAAASALAGVRVGRAGVRSPGEAGALLAAEPRRGLPLRPIGVPPDAVVLERRGGLVAAAARRHGSGRVVQLGYEDTWRWRMEGDDGAPDAHRRWWSAVVGSVAFAPMLARVEPDGVGDSPQDPAPRAALLHALGPAQPDRAAAPTPARAPRLPDSLLLTVALLALLLEWASRRLRGAR